MFENKGLLIMAAGTILSEATERPITLSKLEIEKRRQSVFDAMIHQGGGVLNGQVMNALNLYCTGQLTTKELDDFMLAMESETPKSSC